ncbi:DUF465 domain-containing protein [Pontixanthobacter aestiaquae]|uniref:DUF465 domain-containing protein n=1 Tax=Pontixanthobacter aestiaquae TaxID=1509367 RepID=A0A844Z874_9SPHN|nr:DUF465 domain-containing protein [Pontixanthobacter aestiaquae]MDN3644884.1 DUF465 domain-containing protein [Pontixanthobacter aestiaquae]MXO84115.1 DUF465 domain-containing protein [Pontixanthobacter aestiaquae]
MAHTPHELGAVFSKDTDILHRLKMNGGRFSTLSDEYHKVNRDIHRIEAQVDAASDERMETLKKERLVLLDEITAIVNAARETS